MEFFIGEIVTLKAYRMAYTTIGMVINASPLQCVLMDGSLYTVKSATVIKLKKETQELFEGEFK